MSSDWTLFLFKIGPGCHREEYTDCYKMGYRTGIHYSPPILTDFPQSDDEGQQPQWRVWHLRPPCWPAMRQIRKRLSSPPSYIAGSHHGLNVLLPSDEGIEFYANIIDEKMTPRLVRSCSERIRDILCEVD